ncbi:hypothetical protein RFI_32133, partial [Reticulomyxa filosa]
SVISLIKIQSGSSFTLNEITMTNDWIYFQLAVRAVEDIRKEIREALLGQNNLTNQSQIDVSSVSYYISLLKKIYVDVAFYTTTKVLKRLLIIDWKRNCLNTFDNNNKLKNELPPWDFFVIVKFMSQEYETNLNASICNILTKSLENYQKISKLSHLDLFCLIPCLNYLRSIQSNISDTRFFNDQNIESQEKSKENNMKEMILDILQTELHIRQSRDITPEIFTEAYVILLNIWINITSIDNDITRTSTLAEYPHKTFTRKLVSICKDIIERVSFEVYMK